MSDQQPTPIKPAAETAGDAAPTASAEASTEQALKAAQDAVAALKSETGAGDDRSDAAVRAAQAAIAQAKASGRASAAGNANGGIHGPVGPMAAGSTATPLSIPEFGAPGEAPKPAGLDLLSDVNLHVKVELGRTRMYVEDILRLGPGSVVELDKLAGDPVDIYVNERRVARGEVLVLNDNFCVRVNEILADAIEKK